MNKGGAPKGNQNAAKGRQATQALEIACAIHSGERDLESVVEGNGMKTLVKLWLKQIEDAQEEGDAAKMKLITERLDGRPRQAVDIGGQDENPLLAEVRRTIVDTGNKDS